MALLATFAAGVARAQHAHEPCVAVAVPTGLPPAWMQAVDDLRHELAHLQPSECRRVTLSIERTEGVVRIVAVAEDGRRAERPVGQPPFLVPIAIGLVVSIPPETAALTTAMPAATQASPLPLAASSAPAPAPEPPRTTAPDTPSATIANRSSTTAVWIGFAIGGRVGVPGSTAMADIEGRIDLWLDRWLLFATFHDSPVGLQSNQGVDQDAYREAGAGLGVGRRLALGTAALDVALVPSLVAMRVEADLPQDEGASDVELRIGANVRLSLPLSRGWFLSITADTDIVPNGLTSALRVDPLPVPFPSWTGGLRLGASGALM